MNIENTVYIVYTNQRSGVNENCLMTTTGDYIGIDTGTFYSKKDHYHSPLFKAEIIAVDSKNKTGMYHLYAELNDLEEENLVSIKRKYIGAIVTLREGHWAGEHKVYYCIELQEFFSDDEVKILLE